MDIDLIGCPMDLGQTRRGVDMGPSALRAAQLEKRIEALGHNVHDLGDIDVPEVETRKLRNPQLRYLDEVVRACEAIAKKVEKSARAGHFPLIVGGDHSIVMGTVGGLTKARGPQGIIYVDAHGDFNTTDTTPSGNIHGMGLSAIVGLGNKKLVNIGGIGPKIRPENVALIGVRELDPGEKELIKKSEIYVATMRDIDEKGIGRVMRDAIERAKDGTKGVHITFDVDVLDPREAPGTGTPVPGGLSFRESHLALELLAERNIATSFEIVEVNPLLDTGNKTAELSVGLIESLLGKRIL
ncbi:MAG: arginase [Halobacteriales archaeon]|nr:arginase [Halobacteriales archaeon]